MSVVRRSTHKYIDITIAQVKEDQSLQNVQRLGDDASLQIILPRILGDFVAKNDYKLLEIKKQQNSIYRIRNYNCIRIHNCTKSMT
jgi:hypothetical protein